MKFHGLRTPAIALALAVALAVALAAPSGSNYLLVLALGVDKTDTDGIYSYSFLVRSEKPEGGGWTQYHVAVEGGSFQEAVVRFQNATGKTPDMSTVSAVVFGEDALRTGIKYFLRPILAQKGLWLCCHAAIFRGRAEECLGYWEDLAPGEYAFRHSDCLPAARLRDLLFQSEDDSVCAVVPYISSDATALAGYAVVARDACQAILEPDDARFLCLLSGAGVFEMPSDGFVRQKPWFCTLRKNRCDISVDTSGNAPVVSVSLALTGRLTFTDAAAEESYSSTAGIRIIEGELESALESSLVDFLRRTVHVGADVCGLARLARSNFLTLDQWAAYNWNWRCKKAIFDVSVDVDLFRPDFFVPFGGES